MKKIVITGGHLTPAQAIISELLDIGGWEIYYFGRLHATEGDKTLSTESKVIPEMGVKFIPISTGRLQRQFSRYTIPSLFRVPLGVLQSFYWILKIRPNVICSFGGYVSVPAVISGWLLRIPILTHEQTITFGLSSKINSHFVDKIAVSFPDSVKYFSADKVVLTGNPIRKEIFKTKNEKLKMNNVKPIIYIMGGNQGSQLINNAVLEILEKLTKKYFVIFQCGKANYETVVSRINKLNIDPKNYLLFGYVESSDIGWIMNKADLLISRAGANTICEAAALGKPSLFVPIPWTYQNEQTKNAKMLCEIGIAEMLPQNELSPKTLETKIEQMFKNINEYKKNALKAKNIIKLDAAERIVKLINEISK